MCKRPLSKLTGRGNPDPVAQQLNCFEALDGFVAESPPYEALARQVPAPGRPNEIE